MTPAAIFLTAWAGAFGLVIGSFLNVVAYRMPAGIPLTRESRCPHCDAPIRWWQNVPVLAWLLLRGRCANCAASISIRYPVVETVTGVLFALAALGLILRRPPDLRRVDGPQWFGSVEFWGMLLTLAVFASLSVALTLIDLDTRRLPNAIVLPGWAAIVLLLLITTLAGAPTSSATQVVGSAAQDAAGGATPGVDWWLFVRALIGGAALFLFYYVVRWVSPRGMGGGDVKLAGLVGTVLGWFGWAPLAVGAFAAFALGGVFGLALMVAGRARRRTAIPFGPWMLAGAWLGIAIGEPLGRWYIGLLS
jgi:leader peptidase (prepilin peptidase)/N-methyltransferase